MVFSRKVKEYTEAPITHNIVAEMLPEYNRPNDKISELIKKVKQKILDEKKTKSHRNP